MNKLIFAAAAVATVAVTSGCQRTTVRTVRTPVEVVDTRTVIVDHHDEVYREHRDDPRIVRERVIERERVVHPVPVYEPPRRYEERRYEERRYEEPRRYEERRYEEPRYEEPRRPLPPAHSNTRILRDEVRQEALDKARRRQYEAPPSQVMQQTNRSVTRIITNQEPPRREFDRFPPDRRDGPDFRRAPQPVREVAPQQRERVVVPQRMDQRPQPRTVPNNANMREQKQQSHQAKPKYQERKVVEIKTKVVKIKSHDKKEREEEKKDKSSRDKDHDNKRSVGFGRD